MMRLLGLFSLVMMLSLGALAQSGGVKGKVRGENERGLSGVSINVQSDGKVIKSDTTSSSGEFYITGLADGPYVLTFDKDGHSAGSFRVEVKKGKVIDLSSKNFILPRDKATFVTIQGTVFDEQGFSLPGAKVEIAKKTGGNVWEKQKVIYSSEDGEFLARFNPEKSSEATYRITVTYQGAEPQVKEKVVDFAGIYRLAFNLPIKRTK